jgi:hypothetical protein
MLKKKQRESSSILGFPENMRINMFRGKISGFTGISAKNAAEYGGGCCDNTCTFSVFCTYYFGMYE